MNDCYCHCHNPVMSGVACEHCQGDMTNPTNKTNSEAFTCRICGKTFVHDDSQEGISCLVDHAPGSCCHYTDIEVTNKTNSVGSRELRNELDRIFTKLEVVDIQEDGTPTYRESQPFNNQLDAAMQLITQSNLSLLAELEEKAEDYILVSDLVSYAAGKPVIKAIPISVIKSKEEELK